MQTRHRIIILILLALALPAAHAGGVVSVCDEAHLRTALSGGGAVTFTCSGYIGLTNTITIAANTTIDGSGQLVTISGNSEARVFVVKSGVSLTLSHLTVSWGNDTSSNGGGAVYSDGGHVTITNSMITDNEAAFAGGGVMVYNGSLTVDASTFSSDSASIGGGIAAYAASVAVSNSTFGANFATRSQVADGSGAGIYAEGSQVTVSNSSFATNDADGSGGAIVGDNSTVILTNCTFSRNSAADDGNALARSGSGSMTLKNTIVAHPVYGANCSGTMTDGGGNLSYPDTSCPGINRNPLLQNLNHNGGPTFTMLLGRGSPAIDTANDATCAAPPINNLDQRGVKRPQGAHCDIGAVEQMSYSAPHPRAIDIQPGSDLNMINCRKENQVIAVAILSSPDFDATEVNPATVSFEGATEFHVNKKTGECVRHDKDVDVDGDGDIDRMFYFRLGSTRLTCASTEGTLVGETFEGQGFTGTDSVWMVGRRGCPRSTRITGTDPAWMVDGAESTCRTESDSR